MKRANGMGSVYKLSGKRRKPYAVAVTENGKQIILETFAKQKDAYQYLEDYIKNPYSIDYSKYTTLQLFEEWFLRYKKSKSSKDNIKGAFYKHSKSVHDRLFISLRTKDIQNIIDTCGCKYTVRNYIKIVFNFLYNYADEVNLGINKNYAQYVNLGEKEESNLHKNISNNDLKIIQEHKEEYFIDIILIYIYTGPRTNELLNVEKTKVFLDDDYLIAGSKTKAGKDRVIPIHPDIKPIIEKHYNKSKKFLFEIEEGKKIDYKIFNKLFKETLNKLNLENEYTPYDTRHTFATLSKLSGIDDLIRKLIMGHSISDLTDNTYTHIPKERIIEEVKKLKVIW